jgi:hypothetical protein
MTLYSDDIAFRSGSTEKRYDGDQGPFTYLEFLDYYPSQTAADQAWEMARRIKGQSPKSGGKVNKGGGGGGDGVRGGGARGGGKNNTTKKNAKRNKNHGCYNSKHIRVTLQKTHNGKK